EPTTLLSRLRRDYLNWRANSQNHSAEDNDQLVELETLLLGDDEPFNISSIPSGSVTTPVSIDDAHLERDTAAATLMIPARKAITVSTLTGRSVVIEKPILPPPLPVKGTASFLWTATNTTDGPLHAEQQYEQQQHNNNNHYHNQDGPPRSFYTQGGRGRSTTTSNDGVVDLWAYVDAVGNNNVNNHSAPAALTSGGFTTTTPSITTTTVRRPSPLAASSLLFSTGTVAPPSVQGTSETTRQLSNY
ncbi:Hypothetical protein, putative, partial [Bodo saltans]